MTDNLKLLKYAIDYLSKYSSSKHNLEKILKNKIMRSKIEKKNKFILYNEIPIIISKLEKNKILDDKIYALNKIQFLMSSGKSKIYIKNYLFKKRIEENLISELLKENDENNENWEMESARQFARKKIFKKNTDDKKKILSKMARQGFSYEIAKKILDES